MLIFVAVLFVWLIGAGVNHLAPQCLPSPIADLLGLLGDVGSGLLTVVLVLGCAAAPHFRGWLCCADRRGSKQVRRGQSGDELIAVTARREVAQQWLRDTYGEELDPAETERLQTLIGYGWRVTGAVEVKALRLERGDKSRLFTPAER